MADLDRLLADPQLRPAGGWSARAEAWADDRDSVAWREAAEARQSRERRAEAMAWAAEAQAQSRRAEEAEASLAGLLRAVAA